MRVESDYRGHRIQVDTIDTGDRWNAGVRIRRTLTDEKPHVDTVTCLKVTAELAETAGLLWAKRWVDLKGR